MGDVFGRRFGSNCWSLIAMEYYDCYHSVVHIGSVLHVIGIVDFLLFQESKSIDGCWQKIIWSRYGVGGKDNVITYYYTILYLLCFLYLVLFSAYFSCFL